MKYQQCAYRGANFSNDRVICKSDRLIHKGHVDKTFCAEKCPYADKPLLTSRGLGDTIHKVTHALGIDKLVGDCGGCGKRRNKLNELVPYEQKE